VLTPYEQNRQLWKRIWYLVSLEPGQQRNDWWDLCYSHAEGYRRVYWDHVRESFAPHGSR